MCRSVESGTDDAEITVPDEIFSPRSRETMTFVIGLYLLLMTEVICTACSDKRRVSLPGTTVSRRFSGDE
jgi:hypothetical protein